MPRINKAYKLEGQPQNCCIQNRWLNTWSKDVGWMVMYMKRLGMTFKAGMKYLEGTKSLKHKIQWQVTMKHNYCTWHTCNFKH